MQKVSVKKETFSRLHDFCCKGERHDGLINRLLDTLEKKQEINVDDKTWARLCETFGVTDADELLNMLMDRCREHVKKR
jgi:hypothetical protein